MANPIYGHSPHPPGTMFGYNATTGAYYVVSVDSNGAVHTQNSLIPNSYDYVVTTYTGGNLTTVVYKSGGASGTTVSTLTLAYTGARLNSITKS